MRQVCIDLEFMSLEPTGAITAIGMVEFDLESENTRELYLPVHLATSVRDGGTMDPATVLWWMGEDLLEARRKMLFSAVDIRIALKRANDFLMETSAGYENLIVWSRGARDFVIYETACKRIGLDPWWSFYNERDSRTLARLYPSIELPEFEGIKHFALDDARHDVKCIKTIYKALNGHRLPTQA